MTRLLSLAALVCCVMIPAAPSRAKDITLILSFQSGGGNDLYARAMAKYFGSHLPGRPAVVVQNMPGAGGLRATNFVYSQASRDGSVIALVHPVMPMAALSGLKGADFDALKFNWIGNMTKEPQFCVSWHSTPIKSFADVLAREFIVGATGAGGSMETTPVLFNNLLGTHFKVIAGYQGGNDVLLAMERGEVQGRCAWSLSGIASTRPDWLRDRRVNFVVWMALERDPALPDVPLVLDYAKTDEQRALLRLALAQQQFARPILAPPGVPADQVAELRSAFQATMRDAAFLAEAEKQGLEISPSSGEEVEQLVRSLYATPPETVAKLESLMR